MPVRQYLGRALRPFPVVECVFLGFLALVVIVGWYAFSPMQVAR